MNPYDAFSNPSPDRVFWSRGDFVAAAAVVAALTGFLVPLPPMALDILWVCVLCITFFVAAVSPVAAGTADLKGFSALLSGPALMRVALVAALCSNIWSGQSGGMLIPPIGRAMAGWWPLGAAIGCLIGAVALATMLFSACQRIAAASIRYQKRIQPLKQIGIETDLKMGVITTQQARTLTEKVHLEARLFTHLIGAGVLMRTEGVIEIAAMLACLMVPFWTTSAASGTERLMEAATTATGVITFSLLPATLSAIAAAYLSNKDALTLRAAPNTPQPDGRSFTLLDQDTGRCEVVELLNPDFMQQSKKRPVPQAEQLAEFEPADRKPLIETLALAVDSAQDYYRQLAACVADASPVVLFAAGDVRHLPVTVFVNTAIELVQQGRKALLIDADRQRHALAQVFDADAAKLKKKIHPTGFHGLDLCGLDEEPGRMRDTLKNVAGDDTCILIYAPDADVWADLKIAVGGARPTAFVFAPDAATDQAGAFCAPLRYCRRIVTVQTPSMPSTGQ